MHLSSANFCLFQNYIGFLVVVPRTETVALLGFKLDGADDLNAIDTETLEDDSRLQVLAADASLSDPATQQDSLHSSELELRNSENLALVPVETLNSESAAIISGSVKNFSVENPKDMIARWELDNLDLKNIVKDALISGRLPLAVLKLHLLRSREMISEEETHDTFNEVRDVGRAIAYDLFLKVQSLLYI